MVPEDGALARGPGAAVAPGVLQREVEEVRPARAGARGGGRRARWLLAVVVARAVAREVVPGHAAFGKSRLTDGFFASSFCGGSPARLPPKEWRRGAGRSEHGWEAEVVS